MKRHLPAISDPEHRVECPRHKDEGDKACEDCHIRYACKRDKHHQPERPAEK